MMMVWQGMKQNDGASTGVNVEKDWVMVDYDQVAYPGEVVAKDRSQFKVSDMIFAGKN